MSKHYQGTEKISVIKRQTDSISSSSTAVFKYLLFFITTN
uniref:Uncharacterized protein n=1 Tax=Rhizophora mucronata TaxID=61149 RepID=A0A2P2N5U1_RHIMU